MDSLLKIVADLTVPSADNGKKFTQTDRLSRIRAALKKSNYSLLGERPLAYVYRSKDYSNCKPTILISTHIDSLYENYFTRTEPNEVSGTFDNSACNAVALQLMLLERLPPQVLVAFTGDEENGCIGVDQVIEILKDAEPSFCHLELVITLDLTEEAFGKSHYTVENYFVEKNNTKSLLKFSRKRMLKAYLKVILNHPPFFKNADPDESWQYDEYDLNCFSLCLPCKLLGKDMHEDCGVAIRKKSFKKYADAIERVTAEVCTNLANNAVYSTSGRII